MDHYTSLSTFFEAQSKGDVQATELVKICQTRIQEVEDKVKGFIQYFETPYQENIDNGRQSNPILRR